MYLHHVYVFVHWEHVWICWTSACDLWCQDLAARFLPVLSPSSPSLWGLSLISKLWFTGVDTHMVLTHRETHTHAHTYTHAWHFWVSTHMVERFCNTGSRARSSAGNIPGCRKHKWKWLELSRFEDMQDQRGKVVNFILISKKATSFHKSLDHLQLLDGSNCKLSRCYYLFMLWLCCKSQTMLSRTNS